MVQYKPKLPSHNRRLPVGAMSLHVMWHLKLYGPSTAPEILHSWQQDPQVSNYPLPAYGSMQSALLSVERSGRIARSARGMWEVVPESEIESRRRPARTSGSAEALTGLRQAAQRATQRASGNGDRAPEIDRSQFPGYDFEAPDASNSLLD